MKWYHFQPRPLEFERMVNNLLLLVLISAQMRNQKTKSNCAPDEPLMLENGFPESNCSNNLLVLDWDMFELCFASNYFNFFTHFCVRNDMMFYTVDCELEIVGE